jgi:ferric-dicitrate binding protein FerR (iron transport regulator)
MAAAAVILIGVAATVWTVTTNNLSPSEKQAANASVHTGKQVIYLPDGTQVILNENSELTYDDSFGISDRKVSLVGEATFDVKHDPSKEFIVRTGKVATKVLGTAFNINAFPERQQVTVTVLRGLVQVEDDQQLLGKIAPDEQIEVNVQANAFVRKKVKAEEVVAWQNGFLILDDVALEEAARIIGDKFGVKITFEDPALKKCLFHATFLNDENLSDVLAMMSTVVNVSHTTEEDGSVVIRGKGCN